MNKLDISNIILLTYLTNYDIKLMIDAMSKSPDRDSIMEYCVNSKKLKEKDIVDALENTRIAIQKLHYYGIQPVSIFDQLYPDNLKRISNPPPILYVKGKLRKSKNAAVVGSRKISKYAKMNTEKVVKWLNDENYSIVSGLALGIDSLAHSFCIKNKNYTVAVLPNSLDSVYPKTNYGLANEILNSGGCLISESIFNVNRGKRSFVQRNRIQAAISEVVIPIEMGINSGTMHTINFAKNYKKKILLKKLSESETVLDEYSGIRSLVVKPSHSICVYHNEESFKVHLLKKEENQLNIKF